MSTDKLIHWRDIIKKWEQSNLSQKSFCEAEGINYKTFCYWRGKIQKSQGQINGPRHMKDQNFIPLRIIEEASAHEKAARVFDLAIDSNFNLTSSLQINLRTILWFWDKFNV